MYGMVSESEMRILCPPNLNECGYMRLLDLTFYIIYMIVL
jgi:hypothetical protein